jgi:hypothetical protein
MDQVNSAVANIGDTRPLLGDHVHPMLETLFVIGLSLLAFMLVSSALGALVGNVLAGLSKRIKGRPSRP